MELMVIIKFFYFFLFLLGLFYDFLIVLEWFSKVKVFIIRFDYKSLILRIYMVVDGTRVFIYFYIYVDKIKIKNLKRFRRIDNCKTKEIFFSFWKFLNLLFLYL